MLGVYMQVFLLKVLIAKLFGIICCSQFHVCWLLSNIVIHLNTEMNNFS